MRSCLPLTGALLAMTALAAPLTAEEADAFGGPLLSRDNLTGGWGGARDSLAKHGLKIDLEWTQFYHGLVDGTPDDDVTDGGRVDLFLHFDGQKAGLWPGLFATVHGEFRYGDVTVQGGSLSPVNAALISPRKDGDVFAFTNVTVTQAFSELLLLTVGKFNTMDLYQKEFLGGRGVEGFMNLSLAAPPIAARTVPISTLGAVFTVLDGRKPVFNVGILDARSPATSDGFDGLSSDEITVMADYTFYTKPGGLDGTHNISATWSSIDAFSFDASDFIRPPSLPVAVPTREDDSWQVSYLYEQYLCQYDDDPKRGWEIFLLAGVSDGNPNPIEWSAAAGVSAKGLGDWRPDDRVGLGLFYTGISGELRGLASPFQPASDEYGAEVFYDCAVTPWLRLAADMQVVNPALSRNDTAVYAGLRGRIIF